jgi:hypothetical protein
MLLADPFGQFLQFSHAGGEVFELFPGDDEIAFIPRVDIGLLQAIARSSSTSSRITFVISASCSANSSDRSGRVVFSAFPYRRLSLCESSAAASKCRRFLSAKGKSAPPMVQCCATRTILPSARTIRKRGQAHPDYEPQSSRHPTCAVRSVVIPAPKGPNSTARA